MEVKYFYIPSKNCTNKKPAIPHLPLLAVSRKQIITANICHENLSIRLYNL